MKNPDRAFWLTVVPAVLAWSYARDSLLEILDRGSPGPAASGADEAWSNVVFVSLVALVAGYVGGIIARPQCLRAAANIAFGLVICYGIQNYVDYRASGLPVSYFVSVPAAAAVLALTGGLICRLQPGGGSSA